MIYLDIDVEHLVPRVVATSGFDYWESGQDFLRGHDMFQNFVTYQRLLLAEFRRLADQYGFAVVDARGSAPDIFRALKEEVGQVVRGMSLDQPVVEVNPDLRGSRHRCVRHRTATARPRVDADAQASERSALGGSSQRR